MRRALNAAVVLCEDRCIAPPGFVIEDSIAFELAEAQKIYLQERVLQFPMREHNLADFAEKKRVGYEPMRNRYDGLFSDTRIGFLGENARGIITRNSHITDNILAGWQAGPDTNDRNWKRIKGILSPSQVDKIARIPGDLNSRGTALTWAAISPLLPTEGAAAKGALRDNLQYIYFKQYCSEFKLVILTGVPYIISDFMLPSKRMSYNYYRFSEFLNSFGLREIILDAPAEFIMELRSRFGFIAFVDAYSELGLPPGKWSSLRYGFEPCGGFFYGTEEAYG